MLKKTFQVVSFATVSLLFVACSDDKAKPTEKSPDQVASMSKAASVSRLEVSPLEKEALSKISQLENEMGVARSKRIDVTREETVVWFANEFLKYANWDEANKDAIEYLFGEYQFYADRKKEFAEMAPGFQREKVIEIVENARTQLRRVVNGEIKRRPVNKVDWQNIVVEDNQLLSNDRPIFLYDYFSKSVGRPLTDTTVYNDHLGAIFHGGENLYPVDHDRAINSFLLKEDGTFDQELMREVTEIDNSNVGFLVYWSLGIPEWVEKREPEVRVGRSLFTGYDIDNPLVREVWSKIAEETGRLTRGKKVTQLGYILANEPHWFSEKDHWTERYNEMNGISTYTQASLQQWLKRQYNDDLTAFNQNWESDFASFDQVSIEIPMSTSLRGKPIWYDWSRFNMYRSLDWFTFLQNELRKGNPDADTHIKVMPDVLTGDSRSHGIDLESLTELTSMIGDDAKAHEFRQLNATGPEAWESRYAYFWEEMSLSYDFMESVSPNKIHINSESHFLSAANWRELNTSVDYVHNVYWLATLQGMDANMAWFWARDPDGSPEDRLEGELEFFDGALAGSFAGSVNQQPHIANAYTQVMYNLNSFSEEVMELRAQRRPLRLFYSETSAINKSDHMKQQFHMYEALFFDGFPVGFATEKIIAKQDSSAWDAILVHHTEFVTESEIDALQDYLNKGGTVILDGQNSLTKNQYGRAHIKRLVEGKGTLIRLPNDASIDQVRERALAEVSSGRPDVLISEKNSIGLPSCRWQAVKRDDGSYLVSILNLGKSTAKLSLSKQDNKEISSITDLFTELTMPTEFELKPNGVLLLELK